MTLCDLCHHGFEHSDRKVAYQVVNGEVQLQRRWGPYFKDIPRKLVHERCLKCFGHFPLHCGPLSFLERAASERLYQKES